MRSFTKIIVLIIGVLALSVTLAGSDDRSIVVIEKLNHKNKQVGTYRALLIGIQDYKDPGIPDLETPLNDVRAMGAVLKKKYGFQVEILTEGAATKESMYKALRQLASRAKPEDSVLIYYAGHGDLDRQYDDGWWIPVDAQGGQPFTYMDNSQVQKAMKNMAARHVLLISDSCYSGTLFGTARTMPPVINDKYYLSLYNEKSRWGMTSGNKTPVSDSGTAGHSVFAYQLIKKLKNNDKPYLSTQELYTDIAHIIGNNSEQTPLCRPIRQTGDQGGEFIFIASSGAVVTDTSPVPSKAYLSVESTVSGARVFLDGVFIGTTNLNKRQVSPGPHRLRVEKKGYDPYIKTVQCDPGRTSLFVDLSRTTPAKASIYVDTTPADARVRIMNIREVFSQGMSLIPGAYTIEISKTGYETKSFDITLASGQKKQLDIRLNPEPVAVQVKPETPSAGDTWTDPVTGMEFVWVPEGCCQMGSNSGGSNEQPVHEVCLDGFWMAKTEVTRGQFRKFVQATDYKTDAEKQGKAYIFNKETEWEWKVLAGYSWRKAGYEQDDNHPAVIISWNDAKAFTKWLSQRTNKSYSLPTEAQWEYAARSGGKDEEYSGGNSIGRVAWYKSNSVSKTHRVSTKAPNGLGIYDMSGNVWEWCEDIFDNKAYSKHTRNNPVSKSGSSARVLRGGSWADIPRNCRAAYRIGRYPSFGNSPYGFRLVLLSGQ